MTQKSFPGLLFAVLCLCTVVACQPVDKDTKESSKSEEKESSGSEQASEMTTYEEVDAIEIVESPATGVALGWGWNRGDSEPVPTICVEFVPGEEPAQTRYMTMSEVHDSYDLMQSMDMSAEASVKTIGYEAEGKASFAKSQKLTGNKSHFVMNAIVQNGVRYASPIPATDTRVSEFQSATNERGGSSGSIRLTDEALKKASNIDAFRRHCGSSFVSAIYGGAKLTALLSMESSTKEEKEKLSAEMSGSGWGVKVKAKVDAEAQESVSSQSMDVSIFMTGGKGDAIPVTIQDLKAKMETISMDAYVAPKDFQIAITPYELLSNWPGKSLPDKETEFEELASYWGSYNTLYDDFQRVLDKPQEYLQISVDASGHYFPKFCLPEHSTYSGAQSELKKAENDYESLMAKYNNHWDNIRRFKNPESILKESTLANALIPDIETSATKLKAKQDASATAKTALDECSKKLTKDISFDPEYREQLKRAQDEVLHSLRRIEHEARVCTDKSDFCDFDAKNYRSPYAFRLQLPVPINSQLATFNDVVDFQFGHMAKRQCQTSSNDTACMSNSEIDSWAQKIGLVPINKEYQADLFAQYKPKLVPETIKFVPAGAAVKERSREDVLWYNPNAPVPQDKLVANPAVKSD